MSTVPFIANLTVAKVGTEKSRGVHFPADVVESLAELGADLAHCSDCCNRDQCRNQAVFEWPLRLLYRAKS